MAIENDDVSRRDFGRLDFSHFADCVVLRHVEGLSAVQLFDSFEEEFPVNGIWVVEVIDQIDLVGELTDELVVEVV